ncbi:MAG: helix-turn-helix transcriptional regulator [Rhodospirillales bacterium]|nr:helix-turn-helix transcriptional regulator [Rhodospirillales bacterium]
MFIEEGYARTTTDKVAARCKISKRTLYRLFSSKEDLLAAVVDAHRQSMLDLPGNRDDLPLTDALEAIFIIDIDAEADRERVAFLRFALLESAQFPEIDTLVRQRGPEMALALLADWFAHQRTLGRIEIDDVDSAARMLMDMIFGAVVVKTMGELEWPGGDERKTYIRRCIRVFVNGIRSR